MTKEIKAQPLPPLYSKDGKDCYLDPIRKRLTLATPEEGVRQQMISFLIQNRKVPALSIHSEESLKIYNIKSRKRADLVILYPDQGETPETEKKRCLAVIECKAETVELGHKEVDQLISYANSLECDYAFISNGWQLFSYYYDSETDSYQNIEGIPLYEEMIHDQHTQIIIPPDPPRTAYSDLASKASEIQTQRHFDLFAKDTPLEKATVCLNLLECFWDTSHTLPPMKTDLFEVVQDLGNRLLHCGVSNSTGYFQKYRSFLVKTQEENHIVSFSFNAYGDDRTILCVALDRVKDAHHSLQLGIEDYLTLSPQQCYFFHSGRIAIGRLGSGKVDDLKELVKELAPQLLSTNQFHLGTLPQGELWYLSQPEVAKLVENLISYALVRDLFREQVKKSKQ